MTWIIGIFAVNNDTQVFAWIFAILNSLQVCVCVHIRKYNMYTLHSARGCNFLKYNLFVYYSGCFHIFTSCDKKQAGKYVY